MVCGEDGRSAREPRRIKDTLGPACSSHKRVIGDNWLQRHQRRLEAAMESLGELGKAASAIGIKVTLLDAGQTGNGDRVRFDHVQTANVRGRALAIWHPADADLVAWRPHRVVWHMHGWKEVLAKVAWLAVEDEDRLVGVGGKGGKAGGDARPTDARPTDARPTRKARPGGPGYPGPGRPGPEVRGT